MNILETRRRMLGGEVYKKTAEGNPVSVRSLARMRPGLSIMGKSTQNTTTGAQLFDIDNIKPDQNGITSLTISDGGFEWQDTSESGYMTNRYRISVNPNTNYTLSVSSITEHACLQIHEFLQGTETGLNHTIRGGVTAFTFNSGELSEFTLSVFAEQNGNFKITKVMLCEGTVVIPYEPYTGDKPSPSPDYPQEIESAGDDGNIQVDVTGLNLLRVSGISGSFGSDGNYSVQSETITFSISDASDVNVSINLDNPIVIPPGDYMSISEANWSYTDESKQLQVRYLNDLSEGLPAEWYGNNNPEWKGCKQFTIDELFIITKIKIVIVKGSFQDAVYKIGIIPGNKILPWEPYKQPQSLTVQTPNGLPGIPVNSDGNYTDETGQQWIADYVDFSAGEYVQCVGKINAKDLRWNTNFDSIFHVEGTLVINSVEIFSALVNSGFCNVFRIQDINAQNKEVDVFSINSRIIARVSLSKFSSIQDWNNYINSNDIIFLYKLITPIRTPLSEEQLSAYINLHTNRPTTVVSATDGAGLEITYKTKKSLEVT